MLGKQSQIVSILVIVHKKNVIYNLLILKGKTTGAMNNAITGKVVLGSYMPITEIMGMGYFIHSFIHVFIHSYIHIVSFLWVTKKV